MRVAIPAHWTKDDINKFLKAISQEQPPVISGSKRPKHGCFDCGYRAPDGHCMMVSSTCASTKADRQTPVWWVPRKEANNE